MQYEINYLVLQSKTGELQQIRAEIKKLIEAAGGKISGQREYLKRKLAYEIKHENYGFYTVLRFEMDDPANVTKIKQDLNLNAHVTRYIIVKADSLPDLDQAPLKEEIPVEEDSQAVAAKEVLDSIINQPKEEVKAAAPAAKVETKADNVEVKAKAEADASEEKAAEEEKTAPKAKVESKEETDAVDKKDEKEEKSKKKSKDDGKASLDELDKKLDEILNI